MSSIQNIKISFFCHVPWKWIKQRPHFISEELSRYFDVEFIYFVPSTRKGLVSNLSNIKTKTIYRIPFKFSRKFKILNNINTRLIKKQLIFLSKNSQIIWLTHPKLFKFIDGTNLGKKLLIYDCMDDALAFPEVQKDEKHFIELMAMEKFLCRKADIVFTSSENLKFKLIKRYHIDNKKIYVINNGISDEFMKEYQLPSEIAYIFNKNKQNNSNLKNIVYIGTISEWFDFKLILKSLEIIPNIRYVLFGPTTVSIPKHPRIIYLGSIEHHYLYSIMKKSDILVMPFKLNSLIESVDPVKVYEYIVSGKPALIKKYKETEKFEEYVYLYDGEIDYIEKLKSLLKGEYLIKNKEKYIQKFLKNSLWRNRVLQIKDIIQNLVKSKQS